MKKGSLSASLVLPLVMCSGGSSLGLRMGGGAAQSLGSQSPEAGPFEW